MLHVGHGLIHAGSRGEVGYYSEAVIGAIGRSGWRERDWNPEVDLIGDDALDGFEVRRHYAYDRSRHSAERDVLAHYAGVRREHPLPNTITEDCDLILTRRVFTGKKDTAGDGLYTESWKEAGGNGTGAK